MSQKIEKYKYHYRPEYGTDKLLIEIFNGAEKENFISDFLNAISSINPNFNVIQDLWMNDEILIAIESDYGQFFISKDIWGFAFVMANNNQNCIEKISYILSYDSRFENIAVDFNKYKR